jgi:pilus assembly protein CpaF
MVNGPHDVYVERKGRIVKVDDRLFEGEEAVLHVIERIVAPLGLRVDGSSPYVDARLADGSRVHAILPPLSLCGPVLTVRKFSLTPLQPAELVAQGAMSERMLTFLSACVRGKANVVISGGTYARGNGFVVGPNFTTSQSSRTSRSCAGSIADRFSCLLSSSAFHFARSSAL